MGYNNTIRIIMTILVRILITLIIILLPMMIIMVIIIKISNYIILLAGFRLGFDANLQHHLSETAGR